MSLKRIVLAGFLLVCVSFPAVAEENKANAKIPNVQFRTDPAIELVSIIFRMAGHQEYNRCFLESYAKDIDEHFGKYRDHEVVELSKQLRQTRGIGYDAPMSLACKLTGGSKLREKTPLDPLPAELDKRWTTEDAKNFLAAARQFAEDAKYEDFRKAHESLYATTESRLKSLVEKEAHLEWFSEFFGERSKTAFVLVPSIANGPNNYGTSCRSADGKEEIFCILGVWKFDEKQLPVFDSDVLSTIVHEFCHSHTNALVDRHEAELKPAAEKLFARVEKTMSRNAYGNWKTMMYESLVRASTHRYVLKYQGRIAAGLETLENGQKGFAWIGELSDVLGKYEKDRKKYPTMESFMPELVAFFNKYADEVEKKEQLLDKKRPKVVSMVPANNAADVDPELHEIRVVFDRPMKDGSWSLVGGGPNFPEVSGKPSYNKDRTVWTVKMKLKPEWKYHLMLNSDSFHGFQSADGVPLEPVEVNFATKK